VHETQHLGYEKTRQYSRQLTKLTSHVYLVVVYRNIYY